MNREQTEQEVTQLADTWATAELQGDTTFLEKRLSDDFIGVGPLGFLLTKQEWLARHESGDMKETAQTLDWGRVRAYNEGPMVISPATPQTALRGHPIKARLRTNM